MSSSRTLDSNTIISRDFYKSTPLAPPKSWDQNLQGGVGALAGRSGFHYCARTGAPHLPSWPDCADMQS